MPLHRQDAFGILSKVLKDKISYLNTGKEIILTEEKNMDKGCSNSCEKCKTEKNEDKNPINDLSVDMHHLSSIKKVIAVVSGKGGVGKSMVTSMLAVLMKRKGYHSAVLDADITGPSIPKAFNIKERASGSDLGMYPIKSKTGIDIMSINLLLEHDTDPVVWRGPLLGNVV
jgi:Mrp family chromosome partitioning ATPase